MAEVQAPTDPREGTLKLELIRALDGGDTMAMHALFDLLEEEQDPLLAILRGTVNVGLAPYRSELRLAKGLPPYGWFCTVFWARERMRSDPKGFILMERILKPSGLQPWVLSEGVWHQLEGGEKDSANPSLRWYPHVWDAWYDLAKAMDKRVNPTPPEPREGMANELW